MTKKTTKKKSKPSIDADLAAWAASTEKSKAKPLDDYTITSYTVPAGYTIEQIATLERHSSMLKNIGSVVWDFCQEEETTFQGVIKVLAMLRDYQAREMWDLWEKEAEYK